HPRPLALPSRARLHPRDERHDAPGGLRARGVAQRHLRRQLELARAGVVPAQLPAHRVAAEVPLLPRELLPGRVSGGLGEVARPLGGGGEDLAALDADLPAWPRRPPSGLRWNGEVPERPALPGSDPVPRVLPRRQRRRPRREPSDRLDEPGGEADPAERRVSRRLLLGAALLLAAGCRPATGPVDASRYAHCDGKRDDRRNLARAVEAA